MGKDLNSSYYSGEQGEFSPAVHYLLQAFDTVCDTELGQDINKRFSSHADIAIFGFNSTITLKTQFHSVSLGIERAHKPPVHIPIYRMDRNAIASIRFSDERSWPVNKYSGGNDFPRGYIMQGRVWVTPSGMVRAERLSSHRFPATEYDNETQAQHRLYRRLGVSALASQPSLRSKWLDRTELTRRVIVEEYGCREEEIIQYELGHLAIEELTDFLQNDIGGQIIPGVIDQEIIIQF